MAISVIAILSVSRLDLINRIISSIDYQVIRVIVLILEATLDIVNSVYILLATNSFILNYTIYYSFLNAGMAKGKNYIIANNLSDYILFVNDNVYFPPGFLSKLDSYLNGLSSISGVYQFKMLTNNEYLPSKYDCFIYTASAYNKAGLYDENFYPMFIDDQEWDLRFQKRLGRKIVIPNMFVFYQFDSFTYLSVITKTTLTRCESLNWQYLLKKWKSANLLTSYRFPFNDPYKKINVQYSDTMITFTQKIYLGSYLQPPIYTFDIPIITDEDYVFVITLDNGDIEITLEEDSYLNLFIEN